MRKIFGNLGIIERVSDLKVYIKVVQLGFHYVFTFLFFPRFALKKIFGILHLQLRQVEGLKYYEKECERQKRIHRALSFLNPTNPTIPTNPTMKIHSIPSYEPTIVVFNHPNCVDPLLLFYHLYPFPHFVTSTEHIPWILRLHAWKMRSLMMNKQEASKRSEWIYEQLHKMIQKGEKGLLAIAPTAGKEYPYFPNEKQHFLPDFRTGAFLKKYPILPMVIEYEPFSIMHFQPNESSVQFLWRLLSRSPYTPIYYSIRIFPKIHSEQEKETIHDFKERIKQKMEIELLHM